MSTRGAVIAGAVASALWLALGGLYAVLVWFAVVPLDALRLVIPEVVPARAWYRDAPWMVVLPLLAALLFGALVTLATQAVSRLSAGSPRVLVFAAVWLAAILAALVVGGASALAGTIESWSPPRASFVVRGWFETIAPALSGGVLWGWVPALVATRMRPRTPRKDARLPAAVVAAALLVATVTGGALARATDGILPPDTTQPVPDVLPPVTAGVLGRCPGSARRGLVHGRGAGVPGRRRRRGDGSPGGGDRGDAALRRALRPARLPGRRVRGRGGRRPEHTRLRGRWLHERGSRSGEPPPDAR